MVFSRLIAAPTYWRYANKYGIPLKNSKGEHKTLKQLQTAIYRYETKNLKKGEKGLYYF